MFGTKRPQSDPVEELRRHVAQLDAMRMQNLYQGGFDESLLLQQRRERAVMERPLPELPKLVRTEAAPVPELDALSRELAQDAASLLGYGVGAAQIKRDDLLRQFKALEITPLDTEAVRSYMAAQAERMGRQKAGYAFNWVVTPIEKYPNPIPEFALQTAVTVKRAIQEAVIEVHHLRESKIDPFLAVVLGGAGYFLEVWDEPSFKEGRKW